MLLALSNVTYVLIGWFKFLLLKFLYEYGPWVQLYYNLMKHRGILIMLFGV